MIQLIADSGSTKTDWRLISADGVHAFQTEGYNPYFMNEEKMKLSLSNHLVPRVAAYNIEQIYFYGSGCAAVSKKEQVKNALAIFFHEANIEVETDLVGAARALLGNDAGFISILGTGMNAGWYDGSRIEKNLDSLGFILGDEGSGTYIGKQLLAEYMRNNFPEHLKAPFRNECPLSRDEMLDRVYREPHPNRFLSDFTRFAVDHHNDNYIHSLVNHCFEEFIRAVEKRRSNTGEKIFNAVGSVAFGFRNNLVEVLNAFDWQEGKILRSPIDELVKFHLQK